MDGFADFPDFAKFTGRPPKSRKRPTIFPTGPRIYDLSTRPQRIAGPQEPPPNSPFLGAHGSKDEWDFYWALATIKKDPKNPRQPPFTGGETWLYQKAESPTEIGLGRGRVTGGSVSDFVILGPTGRNLVIRIQTERFHIFTDANQQMKDLFIRDHLRGVEKVVDVYSSDWLGDPSGEAVCRIAALALKGIQLPSPIRDRTALRVRRPTP
jgi:hypothetical protein